MRRLLEGATPASFQFGRTGGGREGKWVVRPEKDAPSGPNVLAQIDADTTDYRFPVAFTGPELKVKSGVWHDLAVDVEGDRIRSSIGGCHGWRSRSASPNQEVTMRTFAVVLSLAVMSAATAEPPKPSLDTAKIEELTGAKGSFNEKEGVFKVSVPRSDLSITAAGVRLTPPMGLTSWAAFKKVGRQTVVMGDMVLLEDQVNPVMSAALDNGLDVTALHNHFFWDNPKVMFMHIGGMGDEAQLATAVGKVLAKIKVTSGGRGDVPHADIDPANSTLDPMKIDAILGQSGEYKNGVYKVTIGRETRMHEEAMGSTMGVNTWAAFAGSDDKAVVDGDFAMLESELRGVLKALRGADINIVAIHQHMSGESPRILFLHYWGIGRTEDLAKGLLGALNVSRTSRTTGKEG